MRTFYDLKMDDGEPSRCSCSSCWHQQHRRPPDGDALVANKINQQQSKRANRKKKHPKSEVTLNLYI